uniref:Dicer-like protein n=1 Tax=Paramecium caudatum TaxID=5885 RepID=W1I779_PARCA|nr:Dicer-like protein [Paramecium caudatum]
MANQEVNQVQSIGYLPPQLSSPYLQLNGKQVLLFLNIFEIDDQRLIIISPRIIEFSCLTVKLFSSNIKPVFHISQRLLVTLEQFKLILSFNMLLFGDLYQNNTSRSISKDVRNLNSFFIECPIPQLNLLVVPGVYSINFEQICEFVQFKLMGKRTPYQPGNLAYSETPYRVCSVLFPFDKQTPLLNFFFYLIDNSIFQNMNELQDHYKVETIKGTLLEFLLNKDGPPSDSSIQLIRKKINISKDDTQFYIIQQMKHLNYMHQDADYANFYCQTCESNTKCSFLQSNNKQIFFASQSQLYSYPLATVFVDIVGRVFQQLICLMKFYAYAQNASYKIQKLATLQRIEEAISCPSYDQERNYQNLEVLGDSVIKYIVSAMLFEDPKNTTESQLSSLRIKLITNKHLSQVYQTLQIHTMNSKIHYKKIRNHMIITINDQQDFIISKKQQADVYEALCGACYVNSYSFKDVIKFFQFTNFGFKGQIEEYYKGTTLIEFEQENYQDNDYPLKKILNNKPFTDKILWEQPLQLLEQSLGYQLKSLREAVTVEDYERLEFLGDAILELLIVANIHKECEKLYYTFEQQQLCREGKLDPLLLLCPGMLHTAKIILLDNGFMGTMALYYNYHHYIRGISESQRQDIERVYEKLKKEEFNDFRTINEYASQIPKIMSDLWESVAASIMIEHGWEAVLKTYGQMYKPFMLYVVDNISLIYNYYQEQNKLIQKDKI